MISEVALAAAIAPELMISGMNRVSTTARSSSDSKCCIALAVSISEKNRMLSQPARLRIIAKKLVSR